MKRMISIQLEGSLVEKLKSLAAQEGITVTAYIRRLILRDLQQHDSQA